MKPIITWVVIADGAQARIFEHDGPGKGLRALPDLGRDQDHLQAREIMADKPGRSTSSSGPGSRSAMAHHSDPVQMRERRFVEDLADMLEKSRASGAFSRLIIAAAPTALGDIRPALTPALRETVIAELPKDLTNMPILKITEHIDGLLAV